ncbi:hypothetical protein FOA52_011344 [Chlamydomonas sp. UWO 241]|nr:hypothetical protein FOA52_011344 [Chlamydomonas sp. UWO 241]
MHRRMARACVVHAVSRSRYLAAKEWGEGAAARLTNSQVTVLVAAAQESLEPRQRTALVTLTMLSSVSPGYGGGNAS